jgi:hypothetical protein
MAEARTERGAWRRDGVPMEDRKPRLLRALNRLYQKTAGHAEPAEDTFPALSARAAANRDPNVPWLAGPEDSWL